MFTSEEIIQIKEAAEKELLQIPGVMAVAVGQKIKAGKPTGEISILVYVEQKKQTASIPANEIVPAQINGVKTDVIETGRLRVRANKGGSELQSEHASGYGTLGCFAFTTETTPRAVLLTNQHVVLDGSGTTPLGGEEGSLICSICSPCCSKILGYVSKVVLNGDVDGAVALLKPGVQIVPEVEKIGVVSNTHNITQAEADSNSFAVRLYSRRQDKIINGHVTSITLSGVVQNHDGSVHRNYTNQIAITSTDMFGDFGDSGSVVFDSGNNIIGLFYGGNVAGTFAMACPIAAVESQLQIKIAKGTAPNQVFTVPPNPSSTAAGAIADFPSVITAGAPLSPRIERLKRAHTKALQAPAGRMYDRLYRLHMNEVRSLVNHNKRVATVWHRNQGPGWLVNVSNSLMDEVCELPAQVKTVRLTTLLNNMASILMQHGSEPLQKDIALHLQDILWYVYDWRSADQLLERLSRTREKSLL